MKIRSHILFETTALKCAVKGEGFFALQEQQQRSRVSQLMKNIRMSSDWLRVALLLSEISRSMACSALYGKDRTMLMLLWVCSFEEWWNSQCAREVVISFAGFCSSLIFIFSIIRTLDYPDYFVRSQRVRIIEVRLYGFRGFNRSQQLANFSA